MYLLHKRSRVFWLVVFSVLLAGCMSGAGTDAPFLLEQDYLRMTDTELIEYEQELSDELVKSSRSGNGDVGVGIGVGSWGSNVGFGVRAGKWLGGSGEGEMTQDLRTRREEVRDEMRRRKLIPE